VLRKKLFTVKYDTSFEKVIDYCSEARFSTWINRLIRKAYVELFKNGYAHSVEAWDSDTLAGGLYGVAFKGAFFGESMFYRSDNASKVAVVSLYETLKKNDYILFDIQMATPVFEQFGAVHISKDSYKALLEIAMKIERKFII
jgi:leucyl/phenylalanyl-tRNA--protein transferase